MYYTLMPDLPVTLWSVQLVDSSQLTTISSLVTNRTYAITMLAYTGLGEGPLSPLVYVKTQQGGKKKNHDCISLLLVFPYLFGDAYESGNMFCLLTIVCDHVSRVHVCETKVCITGYSLSKIELNPCEGRVMVMNLGTCV